MASESLQKHALECLRLQADCMELAVQIGVPHLRAHFVRMARMWAAMADSELLASGQELNPLGLIKQPESQWQH